MRSAFILTSCLLIAGCSMNSSTGRPAGPMKVNPSSLAADPDAFEGRDVEVTGMLVWEAERAGLYQSYGAFCRGAEKASIVVDWTRWVGVKRADNRRQVIVRGTFHNRKRVWHNADAVLIFQNAAGPGPLEPGGVVQWLSQPEKPCPKALP